MFLLLCRLFSGVELDDTGGRDPGLGLGFALGFSVLKADSRGQPGVVEEGWERSGVRLQPAFPGRKQGQYPG